MRGREGCIFWNISYRTPLPGEEEEVGKEDPGEAEEGGGNEESHPEEDGEGLQPPLHRDREGRELNPHELHFHLHQPGGSNGSGELGEELQKLRFHLLPAGWSSSLLLKGDLFDQTFSF